MKERRFYQLLILVLVILNIGIISFFMLNRKPPQPDKRGMNSIRLLDDRLNLTTKQKQKINNLRQIHFDEIRELQSQIMLNKRRLYRQMKQDRVNDVSIDSLTNKLGMLHQQLEKSNFIHFREIREQLTKAQVAQYDKLLLRIFQRKAGPHGRRRQHQLPE
jgi:Spy/CpxP family protein refolding chaperone